MTTIDGVYRSQRLRLMNTVAAATAQAWAQGYRDREAVIGQVLAVVHAGQAQTVALVDAYMAVKAQASPKGLDPTSRRSASTIARSAPRRASRAWRRSPGWSGRTCSWRRRTARATG
jgi:hypothetical protein